MKKRKVLIILLVCILGIVIAAASAILVMRYTGGKSLRGDNKAPELPSFKDDTEITEDEEKIPDSDGKEYQVKYNGHKYKYNDAMINVLFMGIDTETEVRENELYGNGGQVDVILMACVDTENKTVRLLSIPRDTVCEVEIYDYQGEAVGTSRLPISLSHAYGDGAAKSGELTANAVSELLYGLTVHAWYSLNISAIQIVNDFLGGITIVADENNIDYLTKGTQIGDEVVLKGNYARRFIVHRYGENDSSRRIRQRQYLKSFISTALAKLKKNPTLVTDLYGKISEYSTTTLTLDEMVWLTSEMVGMNINDDFITIKGDEIEADDRVEYIVDEKALYETMLEIFYIEVE